MRYPLNQVTVTQEFGSTAVDYSQFGLIGHHGIDLKADIPTPLYAAERGTVIVSQNGYTDPASGRFVAGEVIIVRGTYDCWYLHLSRRDVAPGNVVMEGQQLGMTGNTGYTTGPHLHWGTRPLNPDMNNGYRGFINPKYVIKETEDMITEADVAELRIGHSEIGGWPLNETHRGDFDSKFLAAWKGKPWKKFVFQQWTDGTSKRNTKYAQLKAYPGVVKSLAEANTEIARLKAIQADSSEANLLGQALIKLLSTFGYKKG